MGLTDTTVRNLKPQAKPFTKTDGLGLSLLVTPSGGKLWRFRYRFNGKANMLGLGQWPEITLKEARERLVEARKLLAHGVDPSEARKAGKAAEEMKKATTVETVGREWFDQWRQGKAENHAHDVIARLDNYVFPQIGTRPIAEINPPEVMRLLQWIQGLGYIEAAYRVKSVISQVMRYAIVTGRAERDPCQDLKGALQTPQVSHMPTKTDPAEVAKLLRDIDSYGSWLKTSIVTRAALKLLPLLFCRPGELIAMRWVDIDHERAEWRYTTSKTRTEHLVPLARQALEILATLRPVTGQSEWVFQGARHDRHISNMTVNRALQTMGYDTKTEITGHGFRAMARTMLAERLG
ncbi:MAG: integrase arm-type DNA-binding domain-containing protein, partial [Desulfobulbus sp.]|nr:integrase arm-type DNA-binding domain-containing protein [Desulfobulbus sp.]